MTLEFQKKRKKERKKSSERIMEFPSGHQSHSHHHRRRGESDDEQRVENYPPPGTTAFDDPPPPRPPPSYYGEDEPPPHLTHAYHTSHVPLPPPHSQEFDSYSAFPSESRPPPPPRPSQEFNSYSAFPSESESPPPPPPAYTTNTYVEHVAHDTETHQSHRPHLPSFIHHQTHQSPTSDLSNKRTFRVFSKADPNYSLTIRDGHVILAASDPSDDFQHWYKDEKYSTRVKDEEGFPCFALVNKATGQAIKHSIGATHPVQLIPYSADALDESILWTESKDLGDSFRAIRMVNNIRLNVDAFHGDKKSGGVHDGTTIVLWQWNKGDNQHWKIIPY
jgi:hypothetical protein